MTEPASVPFDGNTLVLWVPTIADPEYPTLTELTGGSVFDATCYFTDTGWAPTMTESAVTDNRLCSTDDFGAPGRRAHSLPMVYVTNPESPNDDEARTTFEYMEEGYIVERVGIPYDTALAAWDFVDVYPVVLGDQQHAIRTANTPWTISQMAYLRAPGRKFKVQVTGS